MLLNPVYKANLQVSFSIFSINSIKIRKSVTLSIQLNSCTVLDIAFALFMS